MSTLDEKYEDEGYRNLMKNFAASAASGDLAGLEKGLAEVLSSFSKPHISKDSSLCTLPLCTF